MVGEYLLDACSAGIFQKLLAIELLNTSKPPIVSKFMLVRTRTCRNRKESCVLHLCRHSVERMCRACGVYNPDIGMIGMCFDSKRHWAIYI